MARPSRSGAEGLWTALADRHDAQARQSLVKRYAGLVRIITQRMRSRLPRHLDVRDLYGAGLVGLLQAIDQFDRARGICFETFATPRIRGAILDELRSHDWLPRRLRRQAREIEATHARLENERGRAVSLADVAEALELPASELEERVQEIVRRQPVSLEQADGDQPSSRAPLEDALVAWGQPAVQDHLERQESRTQLQRALADLPTRERSILLQYYFEGHRLRDIARAMGVSESRVSQLHGRALDQMRQRLHASEDTAPRDDEELEIAAWEAILA